MRYEPYGSLGQILVNLPKWHICFKRCLEWCTI